MFENLKIQKKRGLELFRTKTASFIGLVKENNKTEILEKAMKSINN